MGVLEPVLVLALAGVVLAGCWSQPASREYQADENERPPAKAGSVEDLVGTSWDLGQGRILTFLPEGAGTAARPDGPPADIRYVLKDNGVISIMMMGASRSGTWDGTELIIGGQKATRTTAPK